MFFTKSVREYRKGTTMPAQPIHEEKLHVSVLMPTFNQASFIGRAIESLRAQTMSQWELIIVDDGSRDATYEQLHHYLSDMRIRYHRLPENLGLGVALNHALCLARASLIAYLPSDDLYYADHLASLMRCLDVHSNAMLAYSGVRHEVRVPGKGVIDASSLGQMKEVALQLVQVLHHRTPERWMEREELVTDDLERMFWSKLHAQGSFVGSNQISCQWVDHPLQRHKILQEPLGGINPYRSYYQPKHPLRFHTTKGNSTDEVAYYQRFRTRPDTPHTSNGLKILLVGELAFNSERVLALEERGHTLYGLWTPDGHWFHMVGPVPFGHVQDLPRVGWREAIQQVKPDVIYALLNWETVPFAHHVLTNNPGIPFVWHFKEGPFDCIANGTWSQLLDLYRYADGQIFCNAETRDWFNTVSPGLVREDQSLLLDGDLPKHDWFTAKLSPLLSELDGNVHMVMAGGIVGLQPAMVGQLARRDVHLHCYGDFYRRVALPWIEDVQRLAPDHLHLHSQVSQEQWVSEFSQYDAGWLHIFKSTNGGDMSRVDWPDLNYPARLATLACAGVPFVQYDNSGSLVAMQALARERNLGIVYTDIEQVAEQLHEKKNMMRLRESVWRQREQFTFDFHADRLVDFFRRVIENHHLFPPRFKRRRKEYTHPEWSPS